MNPENAAAFRPDIARRPGPAAGDASASWLAPPVAQPEDGGLPERLARLQAELSDHRQLLAEAQAEHRERIDDIVALTVHYRTRLEEAAEQAGAQAGEIAALKQQVQDLARRLDEVGRHRDSLLNSTSWKITAPLRAVMRTLRGY